jgi:ABC-type iron transport system FetAB permease component
VVALVVLLPFDIGNLFDVEVLGIRNDPNSYNAGVRILLLLFILVPMALSIYSINCLIVGNCHIWAWVQTILILLWVVAFVALIIMATANPKKTLRAVEVSHISAVPQVPQPQQPAYRPDILM